MSDFSSDVKHIEVVEHLNDTFSVENLPKEKKEENKWKIIVFHVLRRVLEELY